MAGAGRAAGPGTASGRGPARGWPARPSGPAGRAPAGARRRRPSPRRLLDQQAQVGAPAPGRRFRPRRPLVEPRPGHPKPCARLHDRVARLLRVDELMASVHRYSWAKKAAAFPRNSAFIRSSWFSRSSSRSRARSETVSGGSSSACSTRYLFTQLPRVPSLIWISRATSAIDRDDSITILTASSLNSGVKLLRLLDTPKPPFRKATYRLPCPEFGRLADAMVGDGEVVQTEAGAWSTREMLRTEAEVLDWAERMRAAPDPPRPSKAQVWQ